MLVKEIQLNRHITWKVAIYIWRWLLAVIEALWVTEQVVVDLW